MTLLTNIRELVTPRTTGTQGDLQRIPDAAIVWKDGNIVWVGKRSELPAEFRNEEPVNAHNGLVIPGLVDCHTHLAFGGWRAEEFGEKILGKSYAAIAREGRGILSTVNATRAASNEELMKRCLQFLNAMAPLGITTVEAKTGYALTHRDEIRLLEVYAALAKRSPLSVVPTLLAAHSIPPEFKERREDYVRLITDKIIPETAEKKLARFCDIFVEETAFTAEEARQILNCAKQHGLGVKLHVDQLTSGNGAELASELGAISADHLEHITDEGIEALKAAEVVAVMLPLASLYARQPALNARPLLERGVRVGVATDFNPGTAPSYHLPMTMMLACLLNRMTPAEVLDGATRMAAAALDLSDRGTLEVGKLADVAVLEAQSVDEWLYHFVPNSCLMTIKAGRVIWENKA